MRGQQMKSAQPMVTLPVRVWPLAHTVLRICGSDSPWPIQLQSPISKYGCITNLQGGGGALVEWECLVSTITFGFLVKGGMPSKQNLPFQKNKFEQCNFMVTQVRSGKGWSLPHALYSQLRPGILTLYTKGWSPFTFSLTLLGQINVRAAVNSHRLISSTVKRSRAIYSVIKWWSSKSVGQNFLTWC